MKYNWQNGIMENVYGNTQNSDGSWNGVSIDNQAPIDVSGSVRQASASEKAKIEAMMSNPKKKTAKVTSKAVYAPEKSEVSQVEDAGKVVVEKKVAGETAKTTAQTLQDNSDSYNTAQQVIAGGEFLVDVMNAQSAYQNATGQARIGIMQARNAAGDAIYRGRQAGLDRQSEGFQAGQDATLAMAAQGQDVQGAGVSKVRGSYEAMGYMNSAREEINSIREALGYEMEEINYEYMQEMAGISRDVAFIGSALTLGAKVAAYGAG